jgi:hypothetical protein
VDGDGDADLLLSNTINYPEFLYRNDDGDFVQVMETEPSLDAGFSEGASWADVDNDGDLDAFITRTAGSDGLYRNDGSWQFTRIDGGNLGTRSGLSSMACWADVDNDGWLDVAIVSRDGQRDTPYRNLDGHDFVPVAGGISGEAAGDARSCAFGDVDDDGDPDLYVGNFIEPGSQPSRKQRNFLFINEGSFRFVERTHGHAVESRGLTYGSTWVDVDNDDDLDLFVSNIGIGDVNILYINDGRGELLPLDASGLQLADAPSKGHAFGDYDLDGNLDVAIANGTEGSALIENRLYLGDGTGGFILRLDDPFSRDAQVSAGVAWADVDTDGDLDLFVANWGDGDQDNVLYRNRATGNWLVVSLEGRRSNRMGIGARVSITVDSAEGPVTQMRWHYPQTGYASQNEPVLHFGLGDAATVAVLQIRWPSGAHDRMTGIAANRRLRIVEELGIE